MSAVSYEILTEAFEFVRSAGPGEHQATIFPVHGVIKYDSVLSLDDDDNGDNIPDDEPGFSMPHANDLHLGEDLIKEWAEQKGTEVYQQVCHFCEEPGSDRRVREYLGHAGLLPEWEQYEEQHIRKRLIDWAAQQGMKATF